MIIIINYISLLLLLLLLPKTYSNNINNNNYKDIIPYSYPLYKQCNNGWASNLMGNNTECTKCGRKPATICAQGCAMSCVSMALAGHNILINNQTATPETLNYYLRHNNGYICLGGDCNNLVLTAPQHLSSKITFISEKEKPSYEIIQNYIKQQYIVIAHVRDRTHFVLCIGWNSLYGQTFLVNDPGFNQTTYSYNDIADIILYDFKSSNNNIIKDSNKKLYAVTGHLNNNNNI